MIHRAKWIRQQRLVRLSRCAEVRLRTLRSANCIVSRLASAHRQLIIESMKFIDRQRQTGLSWAEALIAVLLPGLSLQSVFAITEFVFACLMLSKENESVNRIVNELEHMGQPTPFP